jgi:hypothetical protein
MSSSEAVSEKFGPPFVIPGGGKYPNGYPNQELPAIDLGWEYALPE